MLVESSDGVRIGYEILGQGKPLVLLHGFFGDRETWHAAGYVNVLAEQARLILIDARGHGESDAPSDSASYRMSQQVADVLAVLDALSIERAAFWGSSMGGTIGLRLLATNPNRISAFIATGAHAETVKPPQEEVDREAELFRTRGVAPFIDHLEQQGALPDWMRAAMLAANPHALAALTLGLVERDDTERDDIVGALAQCRTPVLMLAGEHDPRLASIRRTADRLPGAVVVELPGCGHFDAFVRSDLSVPPARTFLSTASGRRAGGSGEDDRGGKVGEFAGRLARVSAAEDLGLGEVGSVRGRDRRGEGA